MRGFGQTTEWLLIYAGALAVPLAWPPGAYAAPPPVSIPITSQPDAAAKGAGGFVSGLNKSDTMLGDMFGLRSLLSDAGMTLTIQETSEILGNVTGGTRRGADYDGLTQAILQLDTERAFGWYGGLFNVSGLQLHGRNLSSDTLSSLQTSSGIEGDRSTRLWELWYDQKFLEDDALDVKIGQQSVDQEFMLTPNGAYFVNTMFGWPLVPSVDLPGGGPAYPLSALGVRLRYRPVSPVAILLGVYNGSPAPSNDGDPQKLDASGTSFPLNGGTLTFLEVQYTYPAIGGMAYPGAAPLGHTYKLGVWYDSERFADQRYGSDGLSLADPASNGIPRAHSGDYSIYAVADQMVWRQPDDPNRSVSIFGRVMYTPQGDRNLVDFALNAGVVYHDPFANRPDDTASFGIGYGHVSGSVTSLDRAAASFDPTAFTAIRQSETYLEATYQYQIRPWWQVQPDMQYVIDPGADVVNPNAPTTSVKNELVIGLRTNILF